MLFQIRRAVGGDGIRRGVALIERVARKARHIVEDLFGFFPVVVLGNESGTSVKRRNDSILSHTDRRRTLSG